MTNPGFWKAMDALIAKSEVVIDRPAGTHHPRYEPLVYEVDYGYLADTHSMDGGGIDLWRGTNAGDGLTAVVVTVDLLKRDSEIKLLIDMTADEIVWVEKFHNHSDKMKGLLIRRA